MKKLIVFNLLLLVMTSGGSQPVTDSLVCIPALTLKSIRIELTELDFIKDTLIVHARKDSLIKAQVLELNSVLQTKNQIIEGKDRLLDLKQTEIGAINDELKFQKKKVKRQKVFMLLGGTGLLMLLVLAL